MGQVYEAIDDTVDSIVAIKETFANTDKLRSAFEHEAKLLANLKHRVLPRVMHHFVAGNGQFLVMEFVEGLNLAELLKLRRVPFSYDEVLPWTNELLDALSYMHSRPDPVIHRDIKPANIKVTNEGELYLLDFGLAKGAAGQETSSVHGYTAAYAPLEQLNNSVTSAQSDLFSLGATLYHLLTAHLPASAVKRNEIIDEGGRDPLIPAHHSNREVPEALSAIISQAMAMKRRDRFASATEMKSVLREATLTIEREREQKILDTPTLPIPRPIVIPGPTEPAPDPSPQPMRRAQNLIREDVYLKTIPSPRPVVPPPPSDPGQQSWPSRIDSEPSPEEANRLRVEEERQRREAEEQEIKRYQDAEKAARRAAIEEEKSKEEERKAQEAEAERQLAKERARREAEKQDRHKRDQRQHEAEEATRRAEAERQRREDNERLKREAKEKEARRRAEEAERIRAAENLKNQRVNIPKAIPSPPPPTVASPEPPPTAGGAAQAAIKTIKADPPARLVGDSQIPIPVAEASAAGALRQTHQTASRGTGKPAHVALSPPRRFSSVLWVILSITATLTVIVLVIVKVVLVSPPKTPEHPTASSSSVSESSRPVFAINQLGSISTQFEPFTVALSADGQLVASVVKRSSSLEVHLWQAKDKEQLSFQGGGISAWGSVAINPVDSQLIASGSFDGTIELRRLNESAPIKVIRSNSGFVFTLKFSADGQTLVSASRNLRTDVKTVQVWHGPRWDNLSTITINPREKISAIDADDQVVAVITPDEGLELRSIADNTLARKLEGSKQISGDGYFSQQGHIFALGVDKKPRILLWRTNDGHLIGSPIEGPDGHVSSIAVSPDGQLVAGGWSDGSIQLWRTDNGIHLTALKGHAGEVRGVSFSSNGLVLASVSLDRSIRLWQISGKQQ
jgi:serine/threonine protein kinase